MAALRLQPRQFAKMRIDGKAYTITNGDVIHLPTRLKNTSVGDTLRLTHAIMVGSRDFTIRGQPFVKEDLFECSATVIEHTKQPMLRTIKKKRRNRHAKLVESKQPYTVLRINKIQIHEPTAVTDRKQL
ncbi:ribosomal protein L21-like protein [Protomyces lactucae-debilis]|uniref:Large ribosomal subunit protein bL21m n=1 Tax=Protomyces lactucae-debilis TaxID=2754530 RepID=A0A1Y2FPB1_PROLT|nr:ribosomal protein L21-like protein [Protomyces lactucae-debilis]ORY85769.1 ribosomal protein L21-like protein [Protomyces lactucae-debilis]